MKASRYISLLQQNILQQALSLNKSDYLANTTYDMRVNFASEKDEKSSDRNKAPHAEKPSSANSPAKHSFEPKHRKKKVFETPIETGDKSTFQENTTCDISANSASEKDEKTSDQKKAAHTGKPASNPSSAKSPAKRSLNPKHRMKKVFEIPFEAGDNSKFQENDGAMNEILSTIAEDIKNMSFSSEEDEKSSDQEKVPSPRKKFPLSVTSVKFFVKSDDGSEEKSYTVAEIPSETDSSLSPQEEPQVRGMEIGVEADNASCDETDYTGTFPRFELPCPRLRPPKRIRRALRHRHICRECIASHFDEENKTPSRYWLETSQEFSKDANKLQQKVKFYNEDDF